MSTPNLPGYPDAASVKTALDNANTALQSTDIGDSVAAKNHDHDTDYEPLGAVSTHESTFDHALITTAMQPGDLATGTITPKTGDLDLNDIGTGGGGASAFTDLTDTPADYSGAAGKLIKVNPTGDALIFGDPSGSSVAWGDITGTISAQTDLAPAAIGAATAVQGTLADTALQPADIATGTITPKTGDLDFNSLGGSGASDFVSLTDTPADYSGASEQVVRVNTEGTALEYHTLTASDVGAEPADATILKDADIGVSVQAYDVDIPTVAVSQSEAEAGTETAVRSWSPERVKQAIVALTVPTSFPFYKTDGSSDPIELVDIIGGKAIPFFESAGSANNIPLVI